MVKVLKIIALDFSIAVINVLVFSKGFLGASVRSENILIVGISIFIPMVSIILGLYLNLKLLKSFDEIELSYDIQELEEPEEYIKALEESKEKLPFLSNEFEELAVQVKRILRKNRALKEYLEQMNLEHFNMEEEIDNSLQYVLENINRALGKTILISAKDKNRSQDEQAIREIIDCNELYLQKYDNFLDEVSELKREPLKDTTELDARIKSLETFRIMNGG